MTIDHFNNLYITGYSGPGLLVLGSDTITLLKEGGFVAKYDTSGNVFGQNLLLQDIMQVVLLKIYITMFI